MARTPPPNPPVALSILAAPCATHALSTRPLATRAGRRYRLFLALPRMAAPERGFPALYLLDGNAAFDGLDAAILARHAGLAVIGIGYETEAGFDFEARSRDYTPPALSGSGLPPGSGHPQRPSSGAPAFLAALLEEILPALEAGLSLDPARRALWGHSYGGLFALFALLAAPRAFSALAIASPSLWWDEGRMLTALASPPEPFRSRLMLSIGGAERRPEIAGAHALDRFFQLQTLLARAPGLSLETHIFAGADHRGSLDRSLHSVFPFLRGL